MRENLLEGRRGLQECLEEAHRSLTRQPVGAGGRVDTHTATTLGQGPGDRPYGTRFFGRHCGSSFAGRYRVGTLLGRGGMGEVYQADDRALRQTVALKFLVLARAADPVEQASLRREARLARGISHPNVCRVFDLVEGERDSCLAMELIDGEDLTHLLTRRGRLPVEEALAIARQIAAGLAAIHDGGLVHCDIKPANVRIDRRGRACILDFGVAVAAGEASNGRRAGTPAYMAPEQRARGEVGARTDLFALGLVLYEMLTGRPAEAAAAALEVPDAPAAGLDARIGAVLTRCLATEPTQRPASALEVAAALGGDRLSALEGW